MSRGRTNWPVENAIRSAPRSPDPSSATNYWTAAESAYATDIMFRDRAALKRIYPTLVHHGVMSFGPKQVLRSWGRSGRVGVNDEVKSDRRRSSDGVRIKHWLNRKSLNCYGEGSVFRSEATTNEPKDFRVWRGPENSPAVPKRWRILRRSVADMYRPLRSAGRPLTVI
jgi:hypothetical protein